MRNKLKPTLPVRFCRVRRNQPTTIRLGFINIGKDTRYDIGYRSRLGEDELGHVELIVDSKTNEMNVYPGNTAGEFNKKFNEVKHPPGKDLFRRGAIRFLDRAYVEVTVQPGTFTLAGVHTVQAALKSPGSSNKVGGVKIYCLLWPFSLKYVAREIKRWLQLTFRKRGKVDYSTRSKAPEVDPAAATAVVMCTWNRIDMLPETIRMLKAQTVPVELNICNNNIEARRQVDEIVGAESELAVTVHHSSFNIGGFGRFYTARRLDKTYGEVVFIDDDQLLEPDTIEKLIAEHQPQTVVSQWAFRFINDRYWEKVPSRPGEPVDYAGTCGMVVDLDLFAHGELFACPVRYWFVEDYWLSYVAKHQLDWELRASSVSIKDIDDRKNQMYGLIDRKDRMRKELS